MKFSAPTWLKLASAALLFAGSAQATVVTQQVFATPHTYFESAPLGTSVPYTVTTAFNKFDAGLGTLTGVSFSYLYAFSTSYTVNGLGSAGSGVSGPFTVFGTQIGGAGNGGSAGAFTIEGTQGVNASLLNEFVGADSYNFDFNTNASLSGGGAPGTVITGNLALVAPSSVTVTYTYDALPAAAVPEPGSLALVAIAGLGAAAVRRRSVA